MGSIDYLIHRVNKMSEKIHTANQTKNHLYYTDPH